MYIPRLCPKAKEKQIKIKSLLQLPGCRRFQSPASLGSGPMPRLYPTRLKEQQEARITVQSVPQSLSEHLV